MVKKRVAYSVYTKPNAVEMKLQGYTTKQVMQELNIKNETQVETWFRWYKNGFFPIGVAYRPNETYSQNILELIELLRTL